MSDELNDWWLRQNQSLFDALQPPAWDGTVTTNAPAQPETLTLEGMQETLRKLEEATPLLKELRGVEMCCLACRQEFPVLAMADHYQELSSSFIAKGHRVFVCRVKWEALDHLPALQPDPIRIPAPARG